MRRLYRHVRFVSRDALEDMNSYRAVGCKQIGNIRQAHQGENCSCTRRCPLMLLLLRGEELSTKSGIGGVSSRLGGLGLRDIDWRLDALPRVLCAWLSWLFDRMRAKGRGGHAMACVANGLAMILVLGVASGGGTGLSVRKRGWICASLTAGLGGRELSGIIIILGGGVKSSSSSGSSDRNGPSRGRAGVVGRLPGMGSKVVPRDGAVCTIASRADRLTLLVSQLSKPSDRETFSIDSDAE